MIARLEVVDLTREPTLSEDKPVASWKSIPEYEGLYEASDQGQIRSVDRLVPHGVGNRFGVGPDGRMRRRKGKLIKQSNVATGHLGVTLSKLGRHLAASVHVLVKETFHGPTPDGMMVCHDNGDPTDNRLENLYFGTAYQNSMDTHRHGTNHQLNKDACPLGHLYVEPNVLHKTNTTRNGIRPSRECRACDNTRCRLTYLKRRGADDGFDFKAVSDGYYETIMRGERKANIKLTVSDVAEIAQSLAAGEKVTTLAERYGVTGSTIYQVKNGKHPYLRGQPVIPSPRAPIDAAALRD